MSVAKWKENDQAQNRLKRWRMPSCGLIVRYGIAPVPLSRLVYWVSTPLQMTGLDVATEHIIECVVPNALLFHVNLTSKWLELPSSLRTRISTLSGRDQTLLYINQSLSWMLWANGTCFPCPASKDALPRSAIKIGAQNSMERWPAISTTLSFTQTTWCSDIFYKLQTLVWSNCVSSR